MEHKYIPLEEYTKLWEDCKLKMRFISPQISPITKNMIVEGLSGPGTDFENEYDRLLYQHLNPPLPPYIDYHELEGFVRYLPEGST